MWHDFEFHIRFVLWPNHTVQASPEDLAGNISAQYEHVILVLFEELEQEPFIEQWGAESALCVSCEDRELIVQWRIGRGLFRSWHVGLKDLHFDRLLLAFGQRDVALEPKCKTFRP